MSALKKYLIFQDDTQYIILLENNTYEVISKPSPDFQVPDDVYVISPRGMQSAIKGYKYDLERKKKAYQKRRAQQEVE